ncbi:Solvent efflux pump outer membrane protein SrpC [bioreactor metagenome]|uniref:Solvent efflux pump outer membrane protein SrpC n=1 Tax=bioreactor metagenome TaxID=1076179 RepID=A0A645EXN5_9ZZZZ
MKRAAAALGLSRSALYPRFALSGSLLYSYNPTKNRRSTSDSIPVIGPVIDIPLFDWGRRRSQADGDEAAMDVAVTGYRQAVLQSISDVETALTGLRAQRERMAALAQVHRQIAARDAMLKRREQLGLASEFSRVDERRALLRNQSDQTVAQGAQALAYVTLYKALGGAPLPADPADKEATP